MSTQQSQTESDSSQSSAVFVLRLLRSQNSTPHHSLELNRLFYPQLSHDLPQSTMAIVTHYPPTRKHRSMPFYPFVPFFCYSVLRSFVAFSLSLYPFWEEYQPLRRITISGTLQRAIVTLLFFPFDLTACFPSHRRITCYWDCG